MSKFLKFNVDLDSFIDELNKRVEENNKKIDELLKIKEKTYSNFVKPLGMMDEYLEQFFTPLSHINSVNNTEKTQEIYADSLPIITEYSTKLSQNLNIYKAYKEIYSNEKNLNQEQKKVLELNIQNFELSGAHLDEKTKERLQEINIRKSELSNDFSQNVLDATSAYEYIITDERDVEGIPQSDLLDAKLEENGVTKYRFTLQMPSYIAYMTYGKNEKIREELYRAYVTRAPQNEQIIDELLALKNEMSRLLGFPSYAAYSLASKMAKDEKSVINFLEKLLINSKEQAHAEIKELQEMAHKPLCSFDTAYYSELLKKEKYDIDEELYRVYFEQISVLNGMFDFLNKLFGIRFKKTDEKLWDEKAVSGVNGVEWDAVEFPSQFLENFAYEPHVLKLFATHHETKETIPDEMIEKLVRSKNFLSASGMLRQLEFSIFDFKLHTELYQGDEVQNLLDSIREESALIKPPSYNKFQNGFSHIFAGGYAAGYYSYKWAEVLSADAFFSVVDEGIFGSEI